LPIPRSFSNNPEINEEIIMTPIKILITDGLAAQGVEMLRSISEFEIDLRQATPQDELAQIIGNYDAMVTRSATTLTGTMIEKATRMRLIVRAGTGVDNIDIPVATERNIAVMNTASANSLAAAEQTLALLFAVVRHIPQSAALLKSGKWDRGDSFMGYEITGRTLAVIGLGNIGRIVAEKAIGLGMRVVGYDPKYTEASQINGRLAQTECFKLVQSMNEALQDANIVTVHVPKTKDTINLINAAEIALLHNKGFVLNCSRGGIVNEDAVIAAIDGGKLAGAAFDVFEREPPDFPQPIFQHPRIVCAAHLGASTFEAQERVALTAVTQMIGFLKHGERTGIIN
jgi:D-3-phosphoglycerate dehydrogenase / 2-oxoglutarate reductase